MQAFAKTVNVVCDRIRLAAISIKAMVIEISGREAAVHHRQKTPGPIVKTLACNVLVVTVEYAMDEPRAQPLAAQMCGSVAEGFKEGECG